MEKAEGYFRRAPFEDLGYAKLDTHRKVRSGFAEVVFCSGKADDHLVRIFEHLYQEEGEVLGTRASREQYALIKNVCPEAVYDPISRIVKVEKEGKKRTGRIAVCTGGDSGYSCSGGSSPDSGVFWMPGWIGFMMWESADSIACWPGWRIYSGPTE